MAKSDEILVTKILSHEFGLTFRDRKFDLGGWGQVDNYVKLRPNRYLFLEVETSQKHPNTNVLKVWPYLEDHPDDSVILAQAFFPDSPGYNSSRGRLGYWLGEKLESLFPGRFKYHRLIVSRDPLGIIEGSYELQASLAAGG